MGYHIGLLIMAAIHCLAPDFIREGRLCWLRSPLYIANNKGTEQYYFTDEEYAKAKTKGLVKGEVTRAKGLGELPDETAHRSMFTEEYQRMDVMEYSDDAMVILEALMGVDVAPRKEFVFSQIDFSSVRE